MMNSLSLLEYESRAFDDMPDLIATQLQTPIFADGLERFLNKLGLKDAIYIGRRGIRAANFVGIIKYKNIQIEILPKMLAKDYFQREQTLKNLMFMLGYTKQLNIKHTNLAFLGNSANGFIETLIRIYAQGLFDALKYTIPKDYVRMTENLNCVRGKLNLTQHIRTNCANQARFYCGFDEFSEDNLLNQMFLFVSTQLCAITKDAKTKKLLRFIVNNYADISWRHIRVCDVDKLCLNRNQKCFETPFLLAKLFLGNMSVDLSQPSADNIALMWDMNTLFEEFVFEFIKRNKSEIDKNITIDYQKGRRLLCSKGMGKKYGNTYVDIFVKTPNVPGGIVLDTKYKLSSRFDNSDVFQVVTYCFIHQSRNAVLLYPGTDKCDAIEGEYYLNMDPQTENTPTIQMATIDLTNDLSQKNVQDDIIKKLKGILCGNNTIS